MEGSQLAYAGEVQHWQGYWLQDEIIGDMQTEIFQASDNRVYGYGCDILGLFTWQGTIEETEVSLVKQYIEGHILLYQGRKPVQNVMTGKWIMGESQEDAFYFERLSGSPERPLATAYLQEWRWQQESVGTEHIVDLVFTNEGKLYGAGTDGMGSFAVLGNHCSNGKSVAVAFLKQYEETVASYEGAIRKRERDMVMKGIWTSEDGECNLFMMTALNAVPAPETFSDCNL